MAGITIFETVAAMREAVGGWHAAGEEVALVPTMGALHEGHIALVTEGRRHARRIIVSIFVNPTQFAPHEDFKKYPRTFDEDCAKLVAAGADAVFFPSVEEMYPAGFATRVLLLGPAAVGLEDRFRPTHFEGVATICCKLFTQSRADYAIFGEKDYQQLKVVTRMAEDLDLGIRVVPLATIREAEEAKPATMEHREDWRDIPLVTIDPADAKDYDDAVYAEPDTDPNNPGGHVVIVAIADVSAYVRPGSALDREALKRGNSVYFPDRVVPMLPERISNDLCSLRGHEDRPAMAVRMVFTAEGRKTSHKFHRIMMRSAARLAYQQAQAAIDGAPDDATAPVLDRTLKPLWAAYKVLKRGRDAREPLELDLPEKKILLTPDGKVDKVIVPERLDAHRMIEEFMIQANVSAAETLEAHHQPLIFRIHDAPALAKQESLREFLRTLDMSLAKGAQLQPAQFNRILSAVEGTDQQELVNQVVLRTQSQAEYSPDNIGHFGLHLRRYAHFTSPIRRYADLIVHRALIKALRLGPDGITTDEEARLGEISALISSTERRAMLAERETVDRLIAHFLASHLGDEYEGRVTGVTRAGLFVNLATYGADGLVPISTLGHEYFLYDEANHAITGERSGKGFRLGDTVTVRLVEALPVAGALRFEMVSEPHPMPRSMLSHHKAGRAGRSGRMARGRQGKPAGVPRHRKGGR